MADPNLETPAASIPAVDSPAPVPAAPASVTVEAALAPIADASAPTVLAADATALVVETPLADTAKPEEPKPHTDEASLLETLGKGSEKKDGEPKVEGGGKPEGEQPKAFEFKSYTVPDGVKLDEAKFSDLNTVLLNDKLDPQARGQELIGLHIREMQSYDKALRQNQQDVFAQTRAEWRKQAMADEEMGGSGWETSKQAIAEARDFAVPQKHQKAFNDFLRTTGAGDHPEFLRLMRNFGLMLKEPSAPRTDFKPPPDIGRNPNGKGRSRTIYDHPSSHSNRGG